MSVMWTSSATPSTWSAWAPARFVSSLQVGYLAECVAGETIELYTGQAGGLWYVHGADQAGKSRFDSAVELAELTP